MRTSVVSALIYLVSGLPPAAADGVEGVWVTPAGESLVRVAPCRGRGEPPTLCGVIVKLKSRLDEAGVVWRDKHNEDPVLRDRPLMGLQILDGFSRKDASRWRGGTVYNPKDGNTYRSKLTLKAPDHLRVQGCVLFLCRTQDWYRATQADIDAPVLERPAPD